MAARPRIYEGYILIARINSRGYAGVTSRPAGTEPLGGGRKRLAAKANRSALRRAACDRSRGFICSLRVGLLKINDSESDVNTIARTGAVAASRPRVYRANREERSAETASIDECDPPRDKRRGFLKCRMFVPTFASVVTRFVAVLSPYCLPRRTICSALRGPPCARCVACSAPGATQSDPNSSRYHCFGHIPRISRYFKSV